jgi:hypothetical protein
MVRFFAVAALLAFVRYSWAQELFDTPEAAAKALIDAADAHDTARLATIIGPQARGILTSGDPARDQAERSEFARLARARQRIEVSPMNPNLAILAIGDEDWPFPVLLRRKNGKWSFDASQTPAEMRARRIGVDELDAIEICHGYVDAQKKYASEYHDDRGMPEYSLRLMSEPGRQNGLYWDGASEPLIPAGLARAELGDARKRDAKPYHGYYFRVLDGQGSSAPGGTHSYVAKGKMIGGFGLVAWPAEYGATGIHTFIVNQDGVVYEKDTAPAPGKAGTPITRFDPDHSWEPVE